MVLHALSDRLAIRSSIAVNTYSKGVIAGFLTHLKGMMTMLACRAIGFCKRDRPTALNASALTTSLLASEVSREVCEKYLAIFSFAVLAAAALSLWFSGSQIGASMTGWES
jgi:uncharacterized membrane protein YcjF (UPF0283 family)